MALLVELRQRKLVQWAVAYVAAAFAFLQGIDIVANKFGWPDSLERILIIALCIGFFITLLLAWYHGERGAQKVSGTELLLLSLLLAIGGGLLLKFASNVPAPAEPAASAAQSKPDPAPMAVGTTAIDARSLAVLPFENLSADKDNEYFASGMQDMILTKLADIRELKVISRTSTEKYKSHPDNLKIIARELGVARIVEGSVQKAGNQVLINVQLIDVATDQHLWAQAYTRTLDNIFGVEGEVATMIAEALKAKLSPAEVTAVAKVPTQNQQAYEAYLKAGYYLRNSNRTGDRDELALAVPLLQQAVQLDPRFGRAYSLLALVYTKLQGYPEEQAAAARKALEIDPDDSRALVEMAFVYSGKGEHDKAIEYASRAARSEPGSAHVQSATGWAYAFAGRFEDSAKAFARLVETEPTSGTAHLFLASPLIELRRYAQAGDALQAGRARDPDDMALLGSQVDVRILGWGDLEGARKLLQSAPQTPERSIPLAQAWYEVNLFARDFPAALAVLEHAAAGMFTQGEFIKAHYQARVFQAKGDATNAHKASLEARDQIRLRIKAQPELAALHSSLALALAGAGECAEGLTEARKGVELEPVSRDALAGPRRLYAQAQVLARCGHVDEAIDQLRHLLQIPAGELVSTDWLRLDPDWDAIRADPHFQALLKEHADSRRDSAGSGAGQ